MTKGISWSSVVETAQGRVRGEAVARGLVFRGLPYGGDTAGTRRFMPPLPPTSWTGVRDTIAFGPRAPQFDPPRAREFDWLFSTPDMSEDCLVLNVYTPSLAGERPVMVWLHGGAFAFGSADVPVLDGTNLAAHGDVVVVTVNHRLNVFGFLSPLAEGPFADSGNAGMLDLVAALGWVRDNIAAFGGDPGQVTIFGQSGGGAKVAVLMGMPLAKGLFHRAIIQSPSSGFRVQEPEGPARFAANLFDVLGLRTGDHRALQALPAAQLLRAMGSVVQRHGGEDQFRPVIDGRSLPGHPFHPVPPAACADMPLMIGTTATEASFYLAPDPANQSLDAGRLHARVKRFMRLDDHAAADVIAAYANSHPDEAPGRLLVHIASDHMYRLTTIEGAEQKATWSRAPVFLYRFAWQSEAMEGHLMSPHTAEMPFVFGNQGIAHAFTGHGAAVDALATRMMSVWSTFARQGDPNGSGLARWTPFTGDGHETMVFDSTSSGMALDPAGDDRRAMAAYRRFVPGSALNFRTD